MTHITRVKRGQGGRGSPVRRLQRPGCTGIAIDRAPPSGVAGGSGALSCRGELGPLLGAALPECEIAVLSGETRTVHLAVPAADLAYDDPASGWTVEPGPYEVIVGRHALDDQALGAKFAIR